MMDWAADQATIDITQAWTKSSTWQAADVVTDWATRASTGERIRDAIANATSVAIWDKTEVATGWSAQTAIHAALGLP